MAPNDIVVPVDNKRTVAVCGLGMVGLSFVEKLLKYDKNDQFRVEIFCEEPLGKYFFFFKKLN